MAYNPNLPSLALPPINPFEDAAAAANAANEKKKFPAGRKTFAESFAGNPWLPSFVKSAVMNPVDTLAASPVLAAMSPSLGIPLMSYKAVDALASNDVLAVLPEVIFEGTGLEQTARTAREKAATEATLAKARQDAKTVAATGKNVKQIEGVYGPPPSATTEPSSIQYSFGDEPLKDYHPGKTAAELAPSLAKLGAVDPWGRLPSEKADILRGTGRELDNSIPGYTPLRGGGTVSQPGIHGGEFSPIRQSTLDDQAKSAAMSESQAAQMKSAASEATSEYELSLLKLALSPKPGDQKKHQEYLKTEAELKALARSKEDPVSDMLAAQIAQDANDIFTEAMTAAGSDPAKRAAARTAKQATLLAIFTGRAGRIPSEVASRIAFGDAPVTPGQ
jgi:hypothetical protein